MDEPSNEVSKTIRTTKNIVEKVLRREHGSFSQHADAFARDCYSSRHMVERMKLSHHLNRPFGTVQALNFNNQGNLICVGCHLEDNRINIIGLIDWARNDVEIAVSTEKLTKLTDTHFVNAENYESQMNVVSVYENGRLRCHSFTPSGTVELTHLYQLSKDHQKLTKCPGKHNELLCASTNGTICHIDLRCEEFRVLAKTVPADAKTKLLSMSHHPLSPQICASYDDHRLRTFDRRNLDKPINELYTEEIKSLTKPAKLSDAFYNYDGSEILVIYDDSHIYLLDSQNKRPGECLNTFRQFGRYTNKISFFGPKSEYVLHADERQVISFIDKVTGHYVAQTALWSIRCQKWWSVHCFDLKPHPNLPVVAAAAYHCSILSPASIENKRTDIPNAKLIEATTKVVKRKERRGNVKQCTMQ